MKINKEYLRFKRWFKENETSFHQGQYSDEDIAFAAFRYGFNYHKNFLNEVNDKRSLKKKTCHGNIQEIDACVEIKMKCCECSLFR